MNGAATNGEKPKVELFRKGRGSQRWQALLRFPDGRRLTFKTPYTDRQKASMSAAHAWARRQRALGVLPPPRGVARVVGRGLLPEPPSLPEGEPFIEALGNVMRAIEGLPLPEKKWVLHAATVYASLNGKNKGS